MVKTVVILGAGWAGLPLAHKLLKHTLPKVNGGLKVYLVSPNSHFFWNVAAVRGVVPGSIPDEHLFFPIAPGFTQYSADNFEFILGKADHIDPEKSTVELITNDKSQRHLRYDHLVIATGSRIRSSLPFKPVGTHEETLAGLHSLQQQIRGAKSIVIGGGGPTGVETAGELAAAYRGEKDITLVLGSEHVLQASQVLPSISQVVEKDLQKLGVKLVRNNRVQNVQNDENSKKNGGSETKTSLALADGSTIVADLYLPLFGVEVNTGFVPRELLDSSGNVNLEKTMRVAGTKNVWGIGDVGNIETKQLTVTDAQIIHLSAALDAVLTDENGQVKDYEPSKKAMIFVTMGKKYATGQIGGWRLWGWMVAYVKGRTLFVDTAPDYVGGKKLRHAAM